GSRLPAGLHRGRLPARPDRVRGDPGEELAEAAGPPVPVRRLPPRRGVARPVHDLQHHLDAVPRPRRRDQHGQLPLRVGRLRLRGRGQDPAEERAAGADRAPAAHRLHAGLPHHRGEQQAPAHLHRAAQRAVRPPPGRPRPGAADAQQRQGPRLRRGDPETDVFGRGKIQDITWKGFLDFYSCTECGRCQSQCPAWNTGKPLSPKMLILEQRDHAFKVAPYLLAGEKERERLPQDVLTLVEKPLVGEDGVIHPDVLWSCTNCGACVEQCPVDIEHIDHILDMRRYQVMIESAFPSEAGVMLKNLENKGNPWGMSEMKRAEWLEELDFEVPVVEDKMPEDVEYLFWVGCAGALEDRAKKTTKAVAELLHIAGVKFAVLGPMEACTGDPARRLGMEFLFAMLAQQNIETLNEAGVKKIVATCPHCFNTLAREYPQFGGHYEVIHHTQLLAKLVEEGRLTPITPIEQKITYHDPCFLGRHNKVYTQPRDIMSKVPGVKAQEMHRCKDRGFCCGAGGARMWMEERIGKRINTERVDEALTTDPDTVS